MRRILRLALGLIAASLTGVSANAYLIDTGKPYLEPDLKTPADFSNVVYIDPDAPTNGTGTIQSPKNTFSGLTLVSDTAYLIKAGTLLNETLSNIPSNFYLGRYGEGDNPILESSNKLLEIGEVTNVTFDGVDLHKIAGSAYDLFLSHSHLATHITFANMAMIGISNGTSYPYFISKSKCQYLVYYQCEFAYVKTDAFYIGGIDDMAFVSNYFHHINMGDAGGDGVQLEYDGYNRFYFANNYMDRSDTPSKFGLIINSEGESYDVVVEWNTFITPMGGNGGAAVRWLGGTDNTFRKNLILTTSGISGVATFNSQANQPDPYGVRDNHWYGPGPMFFGISSWDSSNLGFADATAYQAYLTANNLAAYGSDLFNDGSDTTPPTVPGSVAGYSVLNTVNLSWAASTDNIGVAGYRVYRDGAYVGISGSTSFQDAGLAFDTTYAYSVAAYDGAGNLSSQSAAINVTTGSATDTQAPSVPTGLSASDATQTSITLTWSASTDNVAVTGYNIYIDGANPVDMGNVTSGTITGLAPGVTYAFTVSAYDASSNESAQSSAVNASTSSAGGNLPGSWTFADIGAVGLAGSATYDTGTFTIEGAGADIWGTVDAFAFVYTTLSGDGSITARVTSQENTNSYAKSGVMIRKTLDANSEHALMAITPGGNSSFIRRTGYAGAGSSSTNVAGASTPWWVRLVRSGTSISGYVSADGQSWTLINTASLNTSSDIYVGLAVSSHTTSSLCTAVFDNVSLSGGVPDMEAPTVPTGLAAANATVDSIDLSWNTSTDNESVTGYKVYVDGAAVDVGNYTYATISGLDAETTYSFTVSAYDAAGNESTQSSAEQATTLPPPDTQAPTVPASLAATVDETSAALTWSASTDNVGVTGYRVLRDGVELTTTTSTSYTDTGLTASTTYVYSVSAYDAAANESAAGTLSVTTDDPSGALPDGWTYTDIGSVGLAGSVFYAGGEFTIDASGTDIWYNADAFGFVYTTLAGDGSITARVTAQENTNSYAKSGVMIRETLDANSEHLMMAITPGGLSMLTVRTGYAGASSSSTKVTGASTPWWVRLVRSGNTITGYVSADGQSWTLINSHSMSAGSNIYIGLAVCSHNNSTLNTSVIDNVTIVGDEW